MKPKYELADILALHSNAFIRQYPQDKQVLRTLQAISVCRTKALGGHTCACKSCGHKRHFYNSCRNRHCPKCQAVNRERWSMQREQELLPVPYYHIVFTLPAAINSLAEQYPKQVYNALFQAAWKTIQAFAADPKYLGAKTGMTAVLHTWGQQLWLHPHVHCIVPGGGITPNGQWKAAKYARKYLFPQKGMSKVYRAKFMEKLRSAGVHVPQQTGKALFNNPWVVYAKRPFAGPKAVTEYLSRYTHKVAISNHRITDVNENTVSFHFKDYRKEGKKGIAKLQATEFLRRFCLHILPHGFVRIRHYGILASKNKGKDLNIAKQDLGQQPWQPIQPDWKQVAQSRLGFNPDQCPACKTGIMEMIDVLLPKRGPPLFLSKTSFSKQLTT